MNTSAIALFGEAERGEFKIPYFCETLPQLEEMLGNPPPNSHGLYYAVQALLYHFNLLFIRVQEEGFSYQDYIMGLKLLEAQQLLSHISAVCLPGVGDARIINAATPYCLSHQSLIITREADLYDYLTQEIA